MPARINWEGIARRELHPTQVAIIDLLAEDARVKWSPSAMARHFADNGRSDLTLGSVGYHVKVLARQGTLHQVQQGTVRGAVEHFYQFTPAARRARRSRAAA